MPKSRKGRGANRQNKAKPMGVDLPPKRDLVVALTHTFRYVYGSSSGSQITIYAQDIAYSLGAVSVGSTTLRSAVSSFRINRVQIWPGATATASQASPTSIAWAPAQGEAKDVFTDETLPSGITVSRRTVLIPTRGTAQSFWADSSITQGWFQVVATEGSVMDLTVSYRLSGALPSFPSRSILTTSTVGVYYYPSLDSTGYWTSVMPTAIV